MGLPAEFYCPFPSKVFYLNLHPFEPMIVRIFLISVFLLSGINAWPQKGRETWSRVKVFLSPANTMKKLANTGVETDHGHHKAGHWFISEFSSSELNRIRNAGFETQVLIPDVQAAYLKQNEAVQQVKSVQTDYFDRACNGVGKYKIPENWKYGSMGGHLTYEEMLQHLDSMRILYPALISIRMPVDTIKTENDSTVWYVRISNDPDQENPAEPKALFTAVHHAREPVGMHQLIFFMWYLLENHSANPEIKYLINNSNLFFVPCLNPDGYIFNQQEFPLGGGMWRKNRAKNIDNTFGVDLNRNYGHKWGIDDFGSSPEPVSDVYRGPSAFSEPETQSIKKFCETNGFKLALNYHTFGNLLLNPWGYDGLVPNPDSLRLRQLSTEFIRENNFRTGTCLDALNYNSNGSSDDYMFAENPLKAKILAFTPEVGNEFWPTQDKILPLCMKTVHQNLTAVRALHPMISLSDITGVFHRSGFTNTIENPALRYKVCRVGSNADLSAVFSVTFTPFGMGSDGLSPVTKSYTNIALGQTISDSILLPENALGIMNPDPVTWAVSIDNQIFQTNDTLLHYGGYPYSDDNLRESCDAPGNWTGSWIISSDNPFEGSGFLKTSEGNYSPNQRIYAQRVIPFDLRSTDIHSAEMSFRTRFRIEKNYDMVSLQFSTDSGASWIPVCTDKTKPSSPFSNQAGVDNNGQDTITPVWDGYQDQWRKEIVDLRNYLGNKLWIRFYFRSDEGGEDAGFAVDDIRIRIANILTSVPQYGQKEELGLTVLPNPGDGSSGLLIRGLRPGGRIMLSIRDATGKIIQASSVDGRAKVILPGLKSGCYFVEIQDDSGRIARTKYLVK